ncbi:hypothetical protein L228DRAFT_264776 [Xylona heveae TC161]|uniref:Sulfate transporter family protein n=1 Tax=Xylona heveae (strain CBS 132557 / TC161) TaxID=1328760 RepID=A0A165JL28_XYLHT|nr:hypothetical protein L228DRAFT_264776 [Xylona heveae TC161]KZF26373.1 hypothetical protein L228DRAFT_264776 [Xylona heveae TC161]
MPGSPNESSGSSQPFSRHRSIAIPEEATLPSIPSHTNQPLVETQHGTLLPSSFNQRTPTRSFFHRSYHVAADVPPHSPLAVREQTAELASWALSDAASMQSGSSPPHHFMDEEAGSQTSDINTGHASNSEDGILTPRASNGPSQPEVDDPPSETGSPRSTSSSTHRTPKTSYLTEMLRNSPPDSKPSPRREDTKDPTPPERNVPTVEISQEPDHGIGENTPLLSKRTDPQYHASNSQNQAQDIESLTYSKQSTWSKLQTFSSRSTHRARDCLRMATSPKVWNKETIWRGGVLEVGSRLPAVILGLLMNVLDALSYGMILFPLGEPIFEDLGPDGLSIFYVSCIVSQLVYSCGGSIFKGGIGSEMIEVVPFFHKMAFTIMARVGEDDPHAVIATTILAFSVSSVLTGLVFFLMGACRLGALIGFFPRHILLGCIGGVGWFLVATGFEVSGRLPGSLEYNLPTLKFLTRANTIPLWVVPLALAIILMVAQRWIKSSLFVPIYFLAIPAIFYFFVGVIPSLHLEPLRGAGWIFEMPRAGVPFYRFYTLFDFRAVHWGALAETIPAMFALTFFGVLHVPINVPAMGISSGEDNVDLDRELIAHGISNALSGCVGSIQNYLAYTNSLLFMKTGGDSRLAGILLAIGTFGIMVIGPTIIGYIPIMVVGALIFLLGIDLMKEALYDTWGRVHRLEYFTIVVIVVTMGVWDFVIGILIGIILACVSFVVQTSRKSAIRASYSGEIAVSTVRRHVLQHRFLTKVGQQTHVVKLAGYLFFGTIVSVENRVRAMIDEKSFNEKPIRFLIFDLLHVYGIDFSAAEAFTRISRLLHTRNVKMIVSGVSQDGEMGKSLRNVGLWEKDDVEIFEDLNSALEFCENEQLKAFYHKRDDLARKHGRTNVLNVPRQPSLSFSYDTTFSSPRRQHLQQAATTTLNDLDAQAPAKWQNFKQPLPLILQTFQDLTEKNEDFWFRICPYFEKMQYPAGTILYQRGDESKGFYLLEEGILRADYDLPQGKYYESIVAGTTCGELPFFSETNRTATVVAERDCTAWRLTVAKWEELQSKQPDVARELLTIGLKLTSERMSAITSYVLTMAS